MVRKAVLAVVATLTLAAGVGFSTQVNAGPDVTPVDAQPHMEAALASLRQAKESLQKATADKGGHRAKAIDLVDKAMEQVEKGIKFDNKH